MPRYIYKCNSCSGHFQITHGMSEVHEVCKICNTTGELNRVPQIPFIKKQNEANKKVGETTKEFIEKNRELLNNMKEEARNVEYES